MAGLHEEIQQIVAQHIKDTEEAEKKKAEAQSAVDKAEAEKIINSIPELVRYYLTRGNWYFKLIGSGVASDLHDQTGVAKIVVDRMLKEGLGYCLELMCDEDDSCLNTIWFNIPKPDPK